MAEEKDTVGDMEINLEEISGDIQSALLPDEGESNASKIQRAKTWLMQKRSELKPWHEFLNIKKISRPNSAAEITRRIIANSKTYQANYVLIVLALLLYCIITSPLLLFGLGISTGGCHYISTKGKGQKITMAGREFSVTEQYGLVVLISLPLFFLAGAGSTVFWIIGMSLFVICLHASILSVAPRALEQDLEMQGIEIM